MALSENAEKYVEATLALEKLRKERLAIIALRDAEIVTEDNKYNTAKDTINSSYESQIDAKEAEIAAKEAEIEGLKK